MTNIGLQLQENVCDLARQSGELGKCNCEQYRNRRSCFEGNSILLIAKGHSCQVKVEPKGYLRSPSVLQLF